ncbi:MAG: cytochrome c [Massilia sp.]
MKRVSTIFVLVLAALALAVLGVQLLHDAGADQRTQPVADAATQIARGAYLARAGNCMACHTSRGGQAYAGGREIATTFGSIYTSNLTQDAATGIGSWSADDFWRAIHNGKSKNGSFLYPAFPYPSYTKVTRADADALYAFFKTIPAVRQERRENSLRFPYNQRWLLAYWRSLYFTPGEFAADASRSPAWNRGAYLVQGLGHCAACHTSRDALGGPIDKADLAGAMLPVMNWYASPLAPGHGSGLDVWPADELATLLKTGVSARGAVFGPMAEVTSESLQHLDDADIAAMAGYLKSLPKRETPPAQTAVRAEADAASTLKLGAALYEQHCASCHQADGKGVPHAYPALAGNRALVAGSAINPVRMVLNGGYAPSTGGNPRPYGMPPFSFSLSDGEVAAVVSYVRASWGNQGELVSPVEVRRLRGVPGE